MQPSVCTDSHGCVIESYNRKNHTMAWVEKALKDHLVSTPSPGSAELLPLPQPLPHASVETCPLPAAQIAD